MKSISLPGIGGQIPFCAAALLLGVLVVSNAAATADTPAVTLSPEVAVQVRILEMKTHRAVRDESGVVVWLVAVGGRQRPGLGTPGLRYRMTQHNKTFQPHLLVVPVGSRVEFANLDPWFHDAFSISGSRPFDVGFLRKGVRDVEFDRAGVSYVFCRIHPDMEALVLAVDSPYFGVSNGKGRVSMANVPSGRYVLHVWYEDASRKTLAALTSPIVVAKDSDTLVSVSIAVDKPCTLSRKDRRLACRG